jgi:hypothetical protein
MPKAVIRAQNIIPHLQAAEIDVKYLGHVCWGLAEYLNSFLGG